MDIASAITQRRATRAFLNKPVDRNSIQSVLKLASHSPSGVNSQPWHVCVVQGSTKTKLSEQILAAREEDIKPNPDYQYYPLNWTEPYKTRRTKTGLAMYQALNIGLKDYDKRNEAWNRNYTFFGAPVGLIITIDKSLEKGSWLDLGMFIQNILLAAKAFDLDTCPQASIAEYPDIIRSALNLPDMSSIVCGIALGYADKSSPVNNFELSREPVENFTQWYE